ncbi:MAG: glycoside hydrolase family 10 protein [Bacteroidota bacterium]|jgi:uncharacterized lipoprotein YddW (UPF0748 family)|nr:hypothetical protein C0T31_05020 [Dysgonamonadaceae bacterium]
MKKLFFYITILFFTFLFFFSCNKETDDIEIPEPPSDEQALLFPKKEMRGVWIVTAWELDWPQGEYVTQAQKNQFIDYLDRFKELNINAVFVQIRPMGDAFYDSPYEPWSASITGERGKNPGYDVLQFMIDEAHNREIEFHAWINPYRIATRSNSGVSFPPLHPSIDPTWVVSHEKIQIYNPAIPEVRQRLCDIVEDVITKYDVDGIHFDDYFYPDPSSAGQMISDNADYERYGSGYSSIKDFRRANVDKAIKGVHDVILATKPEIVFSISPAANNEYNFNTLYADVTKWCRESWIDVVIPQLYYEIGNPYNDFRSRLNWWAQYNYNAALMIGYGYYRFGDPSAPSAFQSTAELENQFNLTKRNPKVVGNILYSAKYILLNRIGITDKLSDIFKFPSVIPFLGRNVAPPPPKPENVRIENGILKWSVANQAKSVVYYFNDLNKEGRVYSITRENSIPVSSSGYYCVSTLNSDNMESEPSHIVQKK